MNATASSQPKRYATRQEAMSYLNIGSTKMNTLLQGQVIAAKKIGRKVLVDLDSVDSYYAALPNVGRGPDPHLA
jgi:excisionase family DNA binding protein